MDKHVNRVEPIVLYTGANGAKRTFWPRGHGPTRWYREAPGKWNYRGQRDRQHKSPEVHEQVKIDEIEVSRAEAQLAQIHPDRFHLRIMGKEGVA